MKTKILIAFSILSLLVLGGCLLLQPGNSAKRMVEKASEGFFESKLDSHLTRIVVTTLDSVKKQTLNEETRKLIKAQLASILDLLQVRLDTTATSLRDSLIGDYTEKWLKNLVGDLGDTLTWDVARLRNDLLGKSTIQQLTKLRNSLLDSVLQQQIDSLIDGSVIQLSNSYKAELKAEVDSVIVKFSNAVKEGKNDIKEIIYAAVIGLIIVLIIGFVLWRWANKRKKIVKILTRGIDKIEDRDAYNNLVHRVKEKTELDELDGLLENILGQQKLLDQPEWKIKNQNDS